jgi:DNA-binding NarL/FixJ family response regulator
MAPVRVLIVDDQERFRRAASAVVDSMDDFVVVGTAGRGEDSLTAAAQLRPDLVLMDINLPGIDGLEATRRLRAAADPPVVVLLSTYDQSDYGDETILCGASGYLNKSAFDTSSMLEVWNQVTV